MPLKNYIKYEINKNGTILKVKHKEKILSLRIKIQIWESLETVSFETLMTQKIIKLEMMRRLSKLMNNILISKIS